MINTFQDTLQYKPTKLEFREVTLESPGYFSFGDTMDSCESTVVMEAMIQNFSDMENLIKKNFMIQKDKLSQFAEENPV